MHDFEKQVHEMFTRAVELPPAEWARFVEESSPSPQVRHRVLELLNFHANAGEFLSKPAAQAFPLLSESVGPQLAEFRIVREIGRGGMGIVYLAEDTELKRLVALKVLPPQVDPGSAERFKQEAQAVARLSHPNIVRVFRAGEERGLSYFAMEFIDGSMLRSAMESWPPIAQVRGEPAPGGKSERPPIARLVGFVIEIADALEHAHQNGVIHRDLKPSNIMLGKDGRARLADFGIATVHGSGIQVAEVPAGTLGYMSPEQARVRSAVIDERSDVFSLGVVLYELLAGRRPFEGATAREILKSMGDGRPRRLDKLEVGVPHDLSIICHKAIEVEPRDRYQRAGQLAADLRSFLAGLPILAAPPSAVRRTRHWALRHRTPLLVGAVLFAASASVLAGLYASWLRGEQRAWVVVDPGVESCRAVVQQVPKGSAVPGTPSAVLMGKQSLEPGQYRLTLVRERDGAFCEFNLLLTPGRSHALHIRTALPGEAAERERERVGVFIPVEDLPAGMVAVAAGEFDLRRTPSHPVLAHPGGIPAFIIDTMQVTNREYAEFAKKTGRAWRGGQSLQEHDADIPAMWISLEDAEAYARWRGKRLATVVEWQAAARGPSGQLYPWGNEPIKDWSRPLEEPGDGTGASFQSALRRYGVAAATPAAWDAPGGLLHTFSNVRELTGSLDETHHSVYVIGRAWSDDPRDRDLSTVFTGPAGVPPARTGFRCAKSAGPP